MSNTAITMNRNIDTIIAEARAIVAEFKALPKTTTRDPQKAARLIGLVAESDLSLSEFARRTGANQSTLSMWRQGKTTSGFKWHALTDALAKREGAALAAEMNAGLRPETPKPATPANVVSLHPAAQVEQAPRHAVPVTMWRATNGTLFDTPEEAERMSVRANVRIAARALWDRMLQAGEQDAVDVLSTGAVGEVLGLADAIRAMQAAAT